LTQFLEIAAAVAKVALGTQQCVYVNELSNVGDFSDPAVVVDVLKQLREGGDIPTVILSSSNTVRDFVRLCFFEMGVEVEFSGKGIYEKGVIIDIDEDRIVELSLDADTFKFGEVVVRVNSNL
jgi:GDPmannose 4,6-dehydratase